MYSHREEYQPQFTLEKKNTAEAQTQQIASKWKYRAMKYEKQVFEKMCVKYCKAN